MLIYCALKKNINRLHLIYETQHEKKHTFWNVHQMKIQISLASEQSDQSLCLMAWWNFASLAIQNMPSEDSDQTALMCTCPAQVRSYIFSHCSSNDKLYILGLILLGFNDTWTVVGHFVSSPREMEKRDRRDSKGDEREGQGRKRNRNESEVTEEIKTFPLYPYLLQG